MTKGVCPVCDGSKQVLLTENEKKYSWNKDKTHTDCRNCGSQYMYGRARGEVNLRPDGTPCTHEYKSTTIGRCLTEYKCIHCSDRYEIDSGD